MPLKPRRPEWWATAKGTRQLAIHREAISLYRELGALEEVGKKMNRTREWVRQVLLLHGEPRHPKGVQSWARRPVTNVTEEAPATR